MKCSNCSNNITIIIALFFSSFLNHSTNTAVHLRRRIERGHLPRKSNLGTETKLNFYYDSSSNCWLRELICSKQERQSIALLYL
ncbi:MAG: hypothetical protein ICV56_04095 [Nitrososphaeraceae archaeon]|nr:hypothetical protein [Nitrososphaeraceae archaeon]